MELDLRIFHSDNSQKASPSSSTGLQCWVPREHAILPTRRGSSFPSQRHWLNSGTWANALCEKSRNPGEHDTSLTKANRKISIAFTHVSLLPQLSSTPPVENFQLPASPWGGKEKSWLYSQGSDFSGHTLRTGFCLTQLRPLRSPTYSRNLGALKIKESWMACSSSREPAVLQRDTRGNKRLKISWKKKPANTSNFEFGRN